MSIDVNEQRSLEVQGILRKASGLEKEFPSILKDVEDRIPAFPDLSTNLFDFFWNFGGWEERMHCGIVAWLLDSRDNLDPKKHLNPLLIQENKLHHACGTQFLKDFLECAAIPEEGEILWSTTELDHEVFSPNGKPDIFVDYMVRTKSNEIINKKLVIETKVNQENPEKRLLKYMQSNLASFAPFISYVGLTMMDCMTMNPSLHFLRFIDFARAVRKRLTPQIPNFAYRLMDQWSQDVLSKSGEARWSLGTLAISRQTLFQIWDAFTFLNKSGPFAGQFAAINVAQSKKKSMVNIDPSEREEDVPRVDWLIYVVSPKLANNNIGNYLVQFNFGLKSLWNNNTTYAIEASMWIFLDQDPPNEYLQRLFSLFVKGMESSSDRLRHLCLPDLKFAVEHPRPEINFSLFEIKPVFSREKIAKEVLSLATSIKELAGEIELVFNYVKSHWVDDKEIKK